MCGIFGYVGEIGDVGPIVLDALRTLEYRGYDSWGIAVGDGDRISVVKQTGKINGATVELPRSGIAFGHTRWATHGGVTKANSHPHLDCTGRIAIIHNGIIENHQVLRDELLGRGHVFQSDTDSEIIAHLLEDEVALDVEFVRALAKIFRCLEGLNAVIAMHVPTKELVAIKSVSPLAIGANGAAMTIASDAVALAGRADRMFHLEDHHLVRMRHGSIELYDRWTMESLVPSFTPVEPMCASSELGTYSHYMAREMSEQPEVLERILEQGRPQIVELAAAIEQSYGTFLVGCGTASYAALSGSYLFSRIAKRHVNFVVGSEFKYHEHFLTDRSLVVALSQSGETADVIDAMLAARRRGATLAALINARRSTLDRMVDLSVHLRAGPERCVLSTKAYTAKMATLLLLAHQLAGTYEIGETLVQRAANGLRDLLTYDWLSQIRQLAIRIAKEDHLFAIGRGLSYPSALEAALKIKEVSYVHAEGFAAGELKHGVIALIQDGTPCVVFAPNDETRSDVLSGAAELKCRGGYIIGIGPRPDPVFDAHLFVPDIGDAAPIVNALPAQMLGYEAALLRGNDPDKPRNLAKSVTVK